MLVLVLRLVEGLHGEKQAGVMLVLLLWLMDRLSFFQTCK